MDETLAHAEESFRGITIDSLLEQPRRGRRCRFPTSCKNRGPSCPTTP
jgi:hypothetical protein